jgi:16S rRNA (guanine1207-N2)-methyltransferase
MSAEALKTLFHPFVGGELPAPEKGARVLFLGAEPGFRLPEGWAAPIHAVQGFRPDFRALERMGVVVTPRAEGEGYAATLILAGRHRGLNELRVAEAIERTKPGGLVVVAGSKDDGIASLRRRLAGLVEIEGALPKYHGLAFWFRRETRAGDAAPALRAANPARLVEGRYRTAPGMFSHDRVDAGSRLLVENLPADLRGHVADFCAGWGFVAAEVAGGFPAVSALDLHEADFEALEAARINLEGTAQEKKFLWTDLAAEPVERRYDAVVMNPPFHKGRATAPEIGAGMIRAAAQALKPGGRLVMVANRQLPYEAVLEAAFSSWGEVARDNAFKVFSARR